MTDVLLDGQSIGVNIFVYLFVWRDCIGQVLPVLALTFKRHKRGCHPTGCLQRLGRLIRKSF